MYDFNETSIFSTDYRKILSFMKIRSLGAVFFRTNGRKDSHDEADSRFSQSCERAQQVMPFLLKRSILRDVSR